jgi:hypothetical protein
MADAPTPQPDLTEPVARLNDPEPGRPKVIDADRVGQAAADIGVPVPRGLLVVVGEDGKHRAMTIGCVADFHAAAAILSHLDGKPVSESLRGLNEPEVNVGPEPAWWPPDDFFENPEAQRAYLAERAKHPEWPRFFNSAGDMLELAHAVAPWGIGSGTAGLIIREWLCQHGKTKRTRITQEHETVRALIRAAAEFSKPDTEN